jgi:hypothetical protein
VALLGLVMPALRWLYDYAWFVGFLTAGAIHLALMQSARRREELVEPILTRTGSLTNQTETARSRRRDRRNCTPLRTSWLDRW